MERRKEVYRWLIRQISQHNQQNVIQQKHAEWLHKVLVELCEAGADGDHVATTHETRSHFHFCKGEKHENRLSPFRWLFTRRKKLLRMLSERKNKIMEKREITLVRIFFLCANIIPTLRWNVVGLRGRDGGRGKESNIKTWLDDLPSGYFLGGARGSCK